MEKAHGKKSPLVKFQKTNTQNDKKKKENAVVAISMLLKDGLFHVGMFPVELQFA